MFITFQCNVTFLNVYIEKSASNLEIIQKVHNPYVIIGTIKIFIFFKEW